MSWKKSTGIVHLDDQLIPKPTDVNVADKMTKIPTLKQHPYSSHISKFAIFPSFCPPGDPETGARASSRPSFNSGVTVLTKTKGSSSRHEILELPMKTRRRAVIGLGEHGQKQVSHPTPPKTTFLNPKLCERDLSRSLPERTSNMLKNLEKSLWVTSYQLQYTGLGPANPLKMDDFSEKVIDHARTNSHSALLREKSIPAVISSKLGKECKEGQQIGAESSELSPPGNLQLSQGAAAFTTSQKNLQDATAPDPNVKVCDQTKSSSGWTETGGSAWSRGPSHRQNNISLACETRKRQNVQVRFDEIPTQLSQGSKEGSSSHISGTARPLEGPELEKSPTEMNARPRTAERGGSDLILADAAVELHNDLSVRDKVLQGSASHPRVLPRLPVPSGPGEAGALALLELQDSFSKSAVHRRFSGSVTGAAVSLSNSVATGRKHNFFGINCYYLRG